MGDREATRRLQVRRVKIGAYFFELGQQLAKREHGDESPAS